MHRHLVPSFAIVLGTALLIAGCSSHDDSADSKTTTSTKPTTTSSTGGTTTTTTAADLAAVNIKLTDVAELDRPVAMTTRAGDDTLYVTEKVGKIRAIRNDQLDENPVLDITSLVGSSGN